MGFQPRHKHPFSYAEAMNLEIAVITQEIQRLQNSLAHLERTNNELSEYIEDTADEDVELRDALDENLTAVAAQRERILMLSMVLVQKGASTGMAHYADTNASLIVSATGHTTTLSTGQRENIRSVTENPSDQASTNQPGQAAAREVVSDEEADAGVYL